MKLKLSAGTQLARSGAGLGWRQPRASLPAAAPGQTCSWPDTSPHKCCHLSAFIKAHQSLCSSESWVTNIIANDLCSGIIALNKVNQDQFNQDRHVTKPHLHTDPCNSARKRNATHLLEQKYVWYRKGHSQVKSLEEAVPSAKLRSVALNWGFLQRAGSTCLDFSIYNMGTFSAHRNVP